MDVAIGLVAVILLILASAFFVAAEFALVAVDRHRVESLAERGDPRAKVAQAALSKLSFNLAGSQLGITVTSLVLGFIAEPTVAEVLDPALGFVPEGARGGVSVALALVLVTALTMVVGELMPKGVAVSTPLEATLALARPVRVYGLVFGPLIRFFNGAADRTVRWLGIEPREELRSVRTIDELELLIASSGAEGTIDQESFNLLTRTIRFAQKTAAEVLVPRVDLVTLPSTGTVADLAALSLSSGHSRIPVVGDGPDDIVGIAHVKDVLGIPAEDRAATPVETITVPAPVVPEGRDLESLLTELRAGGLQMAVVADEYGGVAGIVTLEDLLEEIVGDIADEYDPAGPRLTVPLPEGVTVVDGSLHADEVAELTGMTIPDGPYETLAGFVLHQLGRLPEPGDRLHHDGWLLEVLAMDRRRIASVRVVAPPAAAVGEGER